ICGWAASRSPPVTPTPTPPGTGTPPTRRWCVTVPFGDWLGQWLKERKICFRY
ncbi:glycosyl hydrolase family 26, partial [Streptomyces sp. ID01-9D]|nr:glycosyl hydrolase family 26 [Streptomyces sp. ID01-9D]